MKSKPLDEILNGVYRFGNYLVIGEGEYNPKKRLAKCRCDCGAVKDVSTANLRSGRSTQCADCAKLSSKRITSKTHGMSYTPEYEAWKAMKLRCNNPKNHNYYNYGARGISVCERWKVFENFFSDMGCRPSPDHSLDRIDNDGDYTPENCRWALREEQAQNRRVTLKTDINGEQVAISKIAKESGVSPSTMAFRINKLGWSLKDAMNRPVRGAHAN